MTKELEALIRLAEAQGNLEISKDAIDNTKHSEALKCLKRLGKYELKEDCLVEDLMIYSIIEGYILKAQEQDKASTRDFGKDIINLNKTLKQAIDKPIFYASKYGNKYIVPQKLFEEQDKVLEIIKEKCLYKDNLNWVAVCIDYDMYKEKMSEKHDTKVVKIDWNDEVLLDCLKLLTQEEFDILKRYCNGNNL